MSKRQGSYFKPVEIEILKKRTTNLGYLKNIKPQQSLLVTQNILTGTAFSSAVLKPLNHTIMDQKYFRNLKMFDCCYGAISEERQK